MAIIRRTNKNNEARYLLRLRDSQGRWFPARTFKRRVDAEAYERQLYFKRDKGGLASSTIERNIMFDQYVIKWMQEGRRNVSDGWKYSQDQMIRDYILPHIGKLKLIEIRTQDIARVLDRMDSLGRSPQTINHVYNIFHKMFADAVETYGYPERNPVQKKLRWKVSRRERNFLRPEESKRLLEQARDTWVGPAIWIPLLSGLRPGEVQALTCSSVDLANGQILIRSTYNRKTRQLQAHPKQEDWGRAPMPTLLVEYLTPIVEKSLPTAFVCRSKQGGMLCYESFCEILRELCRKAGVTEVTPHELRHSCTELYFDHGASMEDIRRLLNHASASATKHYIHRTDDRLNKIALNVGRVIEQPPTRPVLKVVV